MSKQVKKSFAFAREKKIHFHRRQRAREEVRYHKRTRRNYFITGRCIYMVVVYIYNIGRSNQSAKGAYRNSSVSRDYKRREF